MSAAAIVAAAFGIICLGVGLRPTRFLDNLHSAVLAWIGSRSGPEADRRPRRWFALGLSAYAGGQFLWDIQVALGWNPFPGPSDALFLCFGPCCALGLLASLRARGSRADWGTVAMDAVGLVVVVLVVALAFYLPRRGNTSAWELACMVAYPVGMLGAAGLGAVLIPILRMKLDWASGLFLGGLIVNGMLWMRWNALTLQEALSDGSLYNLSFSITALVLGAGALSWRAVVSSDPRWERACEWILRLLPLGMVGGSVLAAVLVATLPGVPPVIRLLVQAGALVSLALALARQSLLLSERDRLLHAARELRQSERKLSAFRELIIHEASEGLCVTHEIPEPPFIRFTVWNQKMKTITGYTMEEINRLGWLESIYPDPEARARAHERIGRARVGQHLRGVESIMTSADGSHRVVRISTTVIQGEDGVPHVLALMDDVTDRQQAEKIREELETHLRQAQKMEALGTLAGGIAHDFNNILGTILGNVALARQDVGANPSALTSLTEISKASQRAKSLVKQILAFSRMAEPRPQAVMRLGPVVAEVVAMLRATIPAGIELVCREAPDTPNIYGDSNQIHQVLVNLCTNSWHALGSPPRGRIEIGMEQVDVETGATSPHVNLRPGRYACLTVSDDGEGMDAATLERIFEPFYTTKAPGQGTGLGLAVVHGIVRNHQGVISVRSQPGIGTTVSIYLPAVEATAETPSVAPVQLARGRGQRLLYVDDEEGLVLLATRLFERLNYRVTGCLSASEALSKLEKELEPFDLVVTDYNMPGLSGLELAKRVRALRPALPVVLASGYLTEDLKMQAAAAGVAHLVYKPNTVEELCEAVDRVFSGSKEAPGERRLDA
jgi:PAS domain S-box-containing protein